MLFVMWPFIVMQKAPEFIGAFDLKRVQSQTKEE